MNETIQHEAANAKRELLRHSVATLAYRGAKAVREVPEGFSEFQGGNGLRTPGQILAHIGDLLDWALSIAEGRRTWKDSPVLAWEAAVARFFVALTRFDEYLASERELMATPEKLFQGPIADALTHVGQIALLRRLAGAPVKGESYYAAEIQVGRVGAEQAVPRREF